MDEHRIAVKDVADLSMTIGSYHAIFSDVLEKKRVAVKFISKLLNFEKILGRVKVALEWLSEVTNDPELFKRVITIHTSSVIPVEES